MFQIDVMSRRPVYEQLVDQVERYVLMGILKAEEQVPSVRSLSVSLAVNPNTIQKAYSELDHRGVVYSVPGRGCFVSVDARKKIGERKMENMGEFRRQVRELALAGVDKKLVMDCVEDAYQRGGADDDSGKESDQDIR